MALGLQRQRATFTAHTGGPQTQNVTFTFDRDIRNVDVAINGFEVGYTNFDHHLLREQIDANVISFNGPTAVATVTFSLRDSSGTFDDPFSGFVDVLAIADLN